MAQQGFDLTRPGGSAPEQERAKAGARRARSGRAGFRHLAGLGFIGLLAATVPATPASAAVGDITTVAGSGDCADKPVDPDDLLLGGCAEFAGDNGPATSAKLYRPQSPAFFVHGAANYMYFADRENHRVRVVLPGADGVVNGGDDTIRTVAGNPTCGYRLILDLDGDCDYWQGGYSGDGGLATNAKLNEPHAVTVDTAGNLYIADTKNHRVRKVAPGTDGVVNGGLDETITTVAGNGTFGFSGDGGGATSAQLYLPYGVAVDSSGTDLYIADLVNRRVRKVSSGTISTVAGNGLSGNSDGPATSQPVGILAVPIGVALDGSGDLLITDQQNNNVRKVTSGTISTLVGSAAGLSAPFATAIDGSGNLYISDESNHQVKKVTTGGTVTTVAGNGSSCVRSQLESLIGSDCAQYGGDVGPATNALLNRPRGVAINNGDLYIADTNNHRVRRVDLL